MSGMDELGVGLAEAIGQVRSELEEAIRRGADSAVAFRAGPVEIELEVGFQRSGSADGGVRLWVLSVGSRGELSQVRTHRLKVSLSPVDRGSFGGLLVSDIGTE